MSLYNNLILESERRSASPISLAFVVRLLGVLIPLAALFFGGKAYFQSRVLHNRLTWAEAEWAAKEPRYKAAQTLRQDLARAAEIEAEIAAWANARRPWADTLRALRETVPPSVQLTQFQTEERLQLIGTVPARTVNAKLWGRVRGDSHEESAADVGLLRLALQRHPALTGVVSSASIPRGSFAADPAPGAAGRQWVFQLELQLQPLKFE